MKSLAEPLLSFLFFLVSLFPDGFFGLPCELPSVLLGLAPPIAAASCGTPEMATARMTAVSNEVLRMVPPILAAWFRGLQTSVRILESLLYEFIPRAKFPAAMGFQATNTVNLAFLPPTVPGLAVGQRKVDRRQDAGVLREFHVGER